ncbi:M48 family metallopeptidase [Anaerosolibacter sp.]|uniref:M48 family metallopeptidase n=1 Tax=Anaerosolibacter sp. TaxID=1872527 RepID=UPI0039EEF2AB
MVKEKHAITYGGKIIAFDVQRKNVKNINLNVRPDMSIVVSANEKVPMDYILDFVKSKASWIIKNIGYFKDVQSEYTADKVYLSGETFKYLGKQYRLKVVETDESEGVKYYRGYLYLSVKDKHNYTSKEKLINDWYRAKAAEKFAKSLEKMYSYVEKYGIDKPEIQIRTMKARWGSCTPEKKSILLNAELIKAPKLCIDYVVLHELIHFKYRNHNNDFYDFMTSLMPDWKQRKEILDEEIVRDL